MLPRSIIFLIANLALSLASTRLSFDTHDYYVIQHDPNGAAPLHECAERLGVQVVRQVGELANHWVVSIPRPRVDRRSGRDRVLETFKQLRLQAAMGNHSRRSQEALVARRVVSSLKMLERQILRKRVKRDISALPRQAALPTQGAPNGPAVAYATSIGLKDPLFPKQWHIVNDQNPQHMMNITGVWALGVTGKGVTSAMVDDGLDFDSDDLAANFVRSFQILWPPRC
jgi:kexin